MTARWPAALMPAAALVLVSAVLAVQIASGGGRFEPLRPADACAVRAVTPQADGVDGLTERLVLLGLDNAACRLHVSREALTLELGRSGAASDAEIDALHAGLLAAVGQLEDEGALPPASELVDEALDTIDLNGFLKAAVRMIPASVIDSALKTDDVLTRTVDSLDLRSLLADLDKQDDLEQQVESAVEQAVIDSLAARLRDLL